MNSKWPTFPLGEIAEFEGGSQPPKAEFIYEPREGYLRFLQIRDFKSDKNVTFIKNSSKNRLCSEEDILIGRYGASVGQILTGKAGAYNVALMKATPDKSTVTRGFFFHYLNSEHFQKRLLGVADRSAQNGFSKEDIANFPVLVPPLTEQKRIVAILDEAFAGIAAATANAEKNLANARTLFEEQHSAIFCQDVDGWRDRSLGEIAVFKNGLNFTKSSRGDLVNVVGVKDFQKNFWVPMDELEKIRIDGKLSDEYTLRDGDILTVRSNGNKQFIGRCLLAKNTPKNTSHSGFTIRIRLLSEGITPEYLVHFLKSKTSRQKLVDSGDGTNITSLNQKDLSELRVRFPGLVEQGEIVAKIESLADQVGMLVSLYSDKVRKLAELKLAILQRAFSGELTGLREKVLQVAAE